MNLIRYNPTSLTPWFDFDRMVDRFFSPPETDSGLRPWTPAVDIEETDKEVVLKADLPDVDEKDLEVNVENEMLTLKAERKFEKESKNDHYRHIERSYGAFRRSFALPESVNAEKIKASYDKGVLTVSMPKLPEKEKKVRRIKVQ